MSCVCMPRTVVAEILAQREKGFQISSEIPKQSKRETRCEDHQDPVCDKRGHSGGSRGRQGLGLWQLPAEVTPSSAGLVPPATIGTLLQWFHSGFRAGAGVEGSAEPVTLDSPSWVPVPMLTIPT